MTDLFDTPGGSDPDELASAYLDGEAALAELEMVEADVDLLGRVEALGAVRDRLAIDAPPAPMVETQVAVALAAFDELAGVQEPGVQEPGMQEPGVPEPSTREPAASVTDLADRRRWTQRMPIGAVAAAAVVVALAVGVATQLGGNESSDMATGAPDAAIAEDSGASTGGGSEMAGELDAATDFAAPGSDGAARQAFADDESLATYLREQLAADSPDTEPAVGTTSDGDSAPVADEGDDRAERSSDPCDAVRVTGVDPAAVLILVPIVLAGDDATAVAYTDDDQVDQLVVVRDATCEVTLRRTL